MNYGADFLAVGGCDSLVVSAPQRQMLQVFCVSYLAKYMMENTTQGRVPETTGLTQQVQPTLSDALTTMTVSAGSNWSILPPSGCLGDGGVLVGLAPNGEKLPILASTP